MNNSVFNHIIQNRILTLQAEIDALRHEPQVQDAYGVDPTKPINILIGGDVESRLSIKKTGKVL